MTTQGRRPHRVGERIREELSRVMISDLRDPRLGFVTVTEVRMTSDLREARIYVSVMGDDQQQSDSLKALEAAGGFLRRELSHRMQLRRVPSLRFELDHSSVYAEHIEKLLRQNPPLDTEGEGEGEGE